MKNWIGISIAIIGAIHTLLGFVFFAPTLSELWAEGLFNTVNQQPMREACFWFLFSGIFMLLTGFMVRWMEVRNLPIPNFLGWMLLGIAVLTVFIMPVSGGWLMLVPAIALVVKKSKEVVSSI